ncbi:SPOR domain-containing protein [Piscibacillus salipiscarius]|uniref:SPOR domain-containing protein n=1 Tax=Piscibacillus salipiscarius TaxID=299480 RepID=A0ABW5Q6G1_9BACI
MDEQKRVRVTMNQDNQNHKRHDLEYYLTPKNKKSQSSFLTFNRNSAMAKMVKPILLAVLLGVLFGAGLIYYFSDLTPDTLPAATTETDDEEPSSDEPVGEQAVSGSTLSKPASAFEVIQFGMFSNQANAEELIQKKLQPQSIPATIQEQNGQFYVISHLISSESEKSSITDWLESNDLVYMEHFFYKSWNVEALNVKVNDQNIDWYNQGLTLLSETEMDEAWMEQLNAWVNNKPGELQETNKLNKITTLKDQLADANDETHKEFIRKTILLNLHLFYTNLA